jgi:hypothetical protein
MGTRPRGGVKRIARTFNPSKRDSVRPGARPNAARKTRLIKRLKEILEKKVFPAKFRFPLIRNRQSPETAYTIVRIRANKSGNRGMLGSSKRL